MPRQTGFEETADDLYGLPRLEFTAARDAAAGAARTAGDAELAAAIRKMRRPTASAWLANALVRDRGREIAQLIDIGNRIRTAQAELDGGALRRLSEQRRDLVAELSRDTRRIARDRGEKVSDATVRELEETLEAASLDPAAATELRGGRLTKALAYSGMGFSMADDGSPPTEARSASGRTRPSSARGRSKAGGSSSRAATSREADAAAARQAARQADRRAARQEAREARRAADRTAAALAKARHAVERERAALMAAEAEVPRRRESVAAAQRAERKARGEHDAAERDARRAEQRLAEGTEEQR